MNNQAAQTMPERPEFTVDEALRIADQNADAYDKVASVSRTLAAEVRRLAALSQTAGVASLEPWERTSMETLAAALRERGDDLSTDSASWMEKWLAAAPAASGGEVKPEPSPKQCRERVERVCERSRYPNYREVLVGYRVVTRYPDGTTREHFERVR